MNNKSLYTVLGVSPTASEQEIKAAFRHLAKQHHPDKNSNSKQSQDRFREIKDAYAVLSNTDKRIEYDFKIRLNTTVTNMSPAYGFVYNVNQTMNKQKNSNKDTIIQEHKLNFFPLVISIVVALFFLLFIALLKI